MQVFTHGNTSVNKLLADITDYIRFKQERSTQSDYLFKYPEREYLRDFYRKDATMPWRCEKYQEIA